MYNGKYNNRKRRLRWNKQFVLLVSILALLVGVVGGSLAYLVTSTGDVANTFTPGKVACQINETMKDNVKSNVTVKNTGNTDAYIRVRLVATWQDEDGKVCPKAPVEGTDYTITYPEGTKWVKNGEYYYYPTSVAPNAFTGNLIDSCLPVSGQAPAGYTLHVEILADAIQSKPTDAVTQAWGYTPSGN